MKALLAALGFGLAMGSAQAASVSSQFFTGFQQLSDNSAEVLINGANSTGATTVDVGDTLFGIFDIQTIEQGASTHDLGGASGNDELTGVFAIKVLTKDTLGQNGCTSNFCFTFGVSDALISALGGVTLSTFTGDAGTLVGLYTDTTPDFIRQGCTLAGCTATATNDSLYMTLGFGSNGFWQATSISDNIALIGAIPAPGNGGTFNSGLNLITNNSGLQFTNVNCLNQRTVTIIQVFTCGSGSLLGTGGVSTPFDSFDNVDFTVNRVPEPGSVILLGLGLLALAGFARRRA
jgi:hypothetical protein